MTEEVKPTVSVSPLFHHLRNPSLFKGEAGQDPGKWLKEFERTAKYNRWDETISLANVYFFLDGTARQWFENNQDSISSWSIFKEELQKAFGDTKFYARRAEEILKNRAQKPTESTQSYIQNVLGLCHEIDPNMSEEDKVSHLMKGIAENIYQALVTKEIATTADFIKWCQRIENMQQRRVKFNKFERLPNVVSMTPMEEPDLVSLIRRIVREEVQRIVAPVAKDQEPQLQSLESIVRDEVEKALAPVSELDPWQEVKSNRHLSYADAIRKPRRQTLLPQRKTDIWRTFDNRPVCFHCGRPGHVVKYCRERKSVFDAYRTSRRETPQPTDEGLLYNKNVARIPSPSPTRERSPTHRYRSPSPYRRSSQSPSRRNEGN